MGAHWQVRRAGIALWLLSGLMWLAWGSALLREVLVWRLSPWLLATSLAVFGLWCRAFCVTWRRWDGAREPLDLIWLGPVSKRDHLSSAGRAPASPGGFHVRQWQAPVRVQPVLDLQRWLLLRLTADVHTEGAHILREAWVWLDLSPAFEPGQSMGLASVHQLRTLIHLPPAMTMQVDQCPATEMGQGGSSARSMASWPHFFNSGTKLRRFFAASSVLQPSHQLDVGMDSLFPPTQVLEADRVNQRVGRAQG